MSDGGCLAKEDQLTELPEIQYQVEQLENQRSDLMEQLKTCQQELQSSTCRERDLQKELQEKKAAGQRAAIFCNSHIHDL